MGPIREKKHRLSEEAYWGPKQVSITACIENRKRPFTRAATVTPFAEVLTHWIREKNCYAPVYCFMPDHLHVIISGRDLNSRPKEAMDGFKETTGHWFLENGPQYHWQKDYHDHIIRVSDDWRNHVRYILLNPVRAGLASFPMEYPFIGTIDVDIADIIHDL